jgi:hypothetical protein
MYPNSFTTTAAAFQNYISQSQRPKSMESCKKIKKSKLSKKYNLSKRVSPYRRKESGL